MPDVRLIRTLDGQEWDRAVRSVPGWTQFHTWAWLDLVDELFDARTERLLVTVAGRPIGVLPVVRPRARPMIASGLPFPYLGPLVPASSIAATVRAFRAWQRRHGVVFAVFDLPPGSEPAPVVLGGATATASSTIVVDLPVDEGALLEQYSSMRRRSLRRAEREGVVVRPARPGEVEALLDEVLTEAYGAHGVESPYPPGTGGVVERWLVSTPDAFALTAFVGDEPAGVHVVLTGGPLAMSWVVACSRRFREQAPNAVLYHAALAECVRRGFARMDLVGRVDDGVARFKTSFGGAEVPYVAADSFLGPDALRRAAKRLRAARSR